MQHISELIKEAWSASTDADLATPFDSLNRTMKGGFRYQHITVVAGRTAMGKTAFGNFLGLHTAREHDKDVVFFSLEMSARDQLSRFCRTLSEGDERPEGMKDDISQLPIWIDDTPRLSPLIMAQRIEDVNEILKETGDGTRRVHQVVIDYVQLMRANVTNGNRNSELDQIMSDILAMAKKYDVHIILLAQINRGPENRARFGQSDSARPAISDLRDSGTLENTANEILLLYRPDYYEEFETGDGTTEVDVAKNREGRTGLVRVEFVPEEMAFIG